MWRFLLLVIFIPLVGCAQDIEGLAIDPQGNQNPELSITQDISLTRTSPSQPVRADTAMPVLPNLGSAAELTNEVWLNTDRPLRLAELRGQVVLIEMWTFG